jgi:hypothetical protein
MFHKWVADQEGSPAFLRSTELAAGFGEADDPDAEDDLL